MNLLSANCIKGWIVLGFFLYSGISFASQEKNGQTFNSYLVDYKAAELTKKQLLPETTSKKIDNSLGQSSVQKPSKISDTKNKEKQALRTLEKDQC